MKKQSKQAKQQKLANPALTNLFLRMKPIPRISLSEAEKKQMEKNK